MLDLPMTDYSLDFSRLPLWFLVAAGLFLAASLLYQCISEDGLMREGVSDLIRWRREPPEERLHGYRWHWLTGVGLIFWGIGLAVFVAAWGLFMSLATLYVVSLVFS